MSSIKSEIYNITTQLEEGRATAIGNMHKNLVKFSFVVSILCECGHTDILITILHTPPGDKIINSVSDDGAGGQ